MKLYQLPGKQNIPFKVLVDLFVLVLIWQPDWLFPLTPGSAPAAALPWFIIQKIISAVWGNLPRKGSPFWNPACFGYVFGMESQLSFGLKHPGGGFPGNVEWWCCPINRWLENCLGKDICHQGKEQQPGRGLTHTVALSWQVLPWWQGLRCQVQDSCFLWSSPFHFFSCSFSHWKPWNKSEWLSFVTKGKGELSLRDIKRTKVLNFFSLMAYKLILIPLKILFHLTTLEGATLWCLLILVVLKQL